MRSSRRTATTLQVTAGIAIIDNWLALSRLRETIKQNSDLAIVAACRCAAGAMLAVQHYRPAVLILDVQLPDRDGIELIRDIDRKSTRLNSSH